MTGLRFPMPLFAAALLNTAALLTGCQHGPGGTIDPFGRTTIPPPPTGAASIHSRGSQYYGSNPKPMVPVAAAKTNATAATPPQGGPQASAPPSAWCSEIGWEARAETLLPRATQRAHKPQGRL